MFRTKLKEFKEWEWTKRIVYNLVMALFITLIILIALVKMFNIRLDEVLSDSMAPVFTDQDVVVVKAKDSYEINDIIEYKSSEKANVTHRIIAYDPATGIYTTKGDNSSGTDQTAITKDMIRGEVIMIWYNGRAVYHLISDNYFLIITMVVGAWVLSVTLSNEFELKKHNILKI